MPDKISLTDYLSPANILVGTPDESRDWVVKALIKALIESGSIGKTKASSVSRLLNEREAVGSTAIGGGVALPHARVKFLREPVFAFALLRNGTGFNALDGAPVRYVFLVLTPKDDEEMHLAFLKQITLFTREQIHLKALAGCSTAKEVEAVFRDYC